MVRDHGGDALVVVPLAAGFAHRRVALQEPLQGHPAEQADELGPDDGDLFFQVADAIIRFFELGRRAVFGRAAFQNIGDVDLRRELRPMPLVIMSVKSWPARPTNGLP